MRGEEIAAIIVGVGGLVTAIGIQLRGLFGDRFTRRVDAAAALLSGYTQMVANLRKELEACQDASAKAIDATRDHARRNADQVQRAHEADRNAWRLEKAELKAEIATQHREIETLKQQVYALIGRMDGREDHINERAVPPE